MAQDITKSVEYARQRAQRLSRLGELHEQKGQYDKAERAYLRAIDLQPSLVFEAAGIMSDTPLKLGQGTIEDLKRYLKEKSGL